MEQETGARDRRGARDLPLREMGLETGTGERSHWLCKEDFHLRLLPLKTYRKMDRWTDNTKSRVAFVTEKVTCSY